MFMANRRKHNQPVQPNILLEASVGLGSLLFTPGLLNRLIFSLRSFNPEIMCNSHQNTDAIYYTIRNISTDEQQTVISFKSKKSCNEDQNQSNYERIVGNILRGRDIIIITKEDQLKDLISDAVDTVDQTYVKNNATKVVSFIPSPESNVTHHATLLKKMPISVAEDLASSTEFVFGNLWFLIPPDVINSNDVIEDVRKLTPSTFSGLPRLRHEAVTSPAMFDGVQILWFKPNKNILSEQFSYKI